MSGYWPEYVPVAERRRKAQKQVDKLKKQGVDIQPVTIAGRKIAKSFWGAGWCDHLESFSDLSNRLPRGRTYARNGSVCHLSIKPKVVEAIVSGSSLYTITGKVEPFPIKKWEQLKANCTGQVSSVLDLLQGKLSDGVMKTVTDKKDGLFPSPAEIKFSCDCPDYADMCKHIAAVIYGIGARLDESPELLFTLRSLDHNELITADLDDLTKGSAGTSKKRSRRVANDALSDVFGIEMTDGNEPQAPKRVKKKEAQKKLAKKKVAAKRAKKVSYQASEVRALRKKFSMSETEFALLLGVSTPSVINWESASAELNLRKKSLAAINSINGMTKKKAWSEMEKL